MHRANGLRLAPLWLWTLAVLVGSAFSGGFSPLRAAPADGEAEDVKVLKEAGLAVDGPGLLDFFRKRTLKEDQRTKIAGLIKKLGADEFEAREEASKELVKIGPVARPQLQDALKDRDLEVRRRAERALELIARGAEATLVPAAVRQVGRLSPRGTVEILLDYLPNVEEPDVALQVARTLGEVGFKGGKADPALVKALEDKLPVKRAVAGEALAQAKADSVRKAVHKLLRDPVPSVRQRVALALYEARDPQSVDAMIALMGELPRDERYPVEERLINLAGEKAPAVPEGDTPAVRKKYQEAWARWWKESKGGIDLAKVDVTPRLLGYTVLAVMDSPGTLGRVFELDAAGRMRWEITNLRYPIFAQVVGPDRVLIVEYSGNTVSERNFKGEVIWQRPAGGLVLGAQRLPNGNTLIVTRTQIRETDRAGKDVLTINRGSDVASAGKFRDGTFGVLTTAGQCLRLDKEGKTLKAFNVGPISISLGHRTHFLPNGHVVVPQYSQGKVVEYDPNGKVVWEASTPRPQAVARLPNGHTLVASRLGKRVVELDRSGKEVWSHAVTGRPLFADRR